jgi:hypothetical protein
MRPPGFAGAPPPEGYIAASRSRVILGIILGGLVGLGAVCGLASLGAEIPLPVRGAILGALMGVLLAPVIALALFLLMIVPVVNIGLLGILGDCTWSRISDALIHRRVRFLLLPFMILVVLPMALCGFGGSKVKATSSAMHLPAALGALVLGAVGGGIVANSPQRRQDQNKFTTQAGA